MKKKSKKWIWILAVIAIFVCVHACGSKSPEIELPTSLLPTVSEPAAEQPMEDTESTIQETSAPVIGGIRPEFKEAMDSYESFYDEYCEFMSAYRDNPTDIKLLTGYAGMLEKAADMDKKFEAWDESDMSNEELKYYLDVTTRIQKKMIDIL